MDYMSSLRPPSKAMIVYLWSLISFRRWPSSQPTRRTSQWQILPISSWNECGSILGYHRPSSPNGTTGSSAHFGQVFGHCWTPSSLNPLLSTPKQMSKHRSSIGLLCTSRACTTLRICVQGMRVSPMFNTITIGLSIAPPAIAHFRWGWDSNPWVPFMLHYLLKPHKQNLPMFSLRMKNPPDSLNGFNTSTNGSMRFCRKSILSTSGIMINIGYHTSFRLEIRSGYICRKSVLQGPIEISTHFTMGLTLSPRL
jgi:hypothetical protein